CHPAAAVTRLSHTTVVIMKCVTVFACLVGVAICAPQLRQQQYVDEQLLEEEQQFPEPYQFSLTVNDDPSTNYQTRQEAQNENGQVQGEYSWVAADGFRYITRYTADPLNGFQAQTIKEPTDIVVVIPQPQPQYQQQIRV
ncbi:unnamed protein product, partial [Meganyctiphanes norvegica]